MKKPVNAASEGRSGGAPDVHSLWVAARIPTFPEHENMEAVVKKFPEKPEDDDLQRPSRAEAEAAVATLLRWIGENPKREGLKETPKRVVKAYEELFGGYGHEPSEVLGRVFEEVAGYNDIVLVKDISFHTHCEHHMVPVLGKAHVAYLPDGKVLGLSKIARLVDMFGRRLQTQEAMTAQIADALDRTLKPRGVAVILEAEHLCMSMRGIRSHGSSTYTGTYRGVFADDQVQQDRILRLIGLSA